jgi:hypothetical protein
MTLAIKRGKYEGKYEGSGLNYRENMRGQVSTIDTLVSL